MQRKMYRQGCHCEPVRRLVWQSVPLPKYRFIQILPSGIQGFDQLVFTLPIPAFELLLSFYGCSNIRCCFIVHQLVYVIFCSKTIWIQLMPVLVNPPDQIFCDTNIYHCSCGVCQNIDIVLHSVLPFLRIYMLSGYADCHVATLLAMTRKL